MTPILKYAILTCKHKWFVFLAGYKLDVPLWKLIIHDWSKFLPSELPHYGRQFFGKADDPRGFSLCWLRHQNRHPHHWEYWIPRTGHGRSNDSQYGDMIPLHMEIWAVKEMIADWMGAGRAYEGKWPDTKDWTWLNAHMPKMKLHPDTKLDIEYLINRICLIL
ncbi:hypothetical protein LCGC14_0671700 [marine sediment metagenome]|uniref:Uncharacterized protein n=1 Tax=marine sediment metagenome TaxID=412755 RepID=A0A0F9QVU7_9ZZZZ